MKTTLIWCLVCKRWISVYPHADYCPRCGNDEIEKDEEPDLDLRHDARRNGDYDDR